MKKVKSPRLKDVLDNGEFKLSKHSLVWYQMQKKEKGKAIFTSESSGKTFTKNWNTPVFLGEV